MAFKVANPNYFMEDQDELITRKSDCEEAKSKAALEDIGYKV